MSITIQNNDLVLNDHMNIMGPKRSHECNGPKRSHEYNGPKR